MKLLNDFFKFSIFMTIWIWLLIAYGFAFGATVDRMERMGGFIVNIMLDGEPVKEIDGIAVVPFESEYQIYLKNDNR